VRRVVTGEDELGRSAVVEDGEPAHSVSLDSTGFAEHAVWQVDLAPSDVHAGCDPVTDPARGPGMLRIETIDLLVVVAGEVDLVLEAEAVRLRADDCVVQRGTWIAWANPGDEPCVTAGLMVATDG
jgi:hypothetical protein